jgi:hypothetical protein
MVQELGRWAEAVEVLRARLAPHFRRAEPRRRVRASVEGLLGVAEHTGPTHGNTTTAPGPDDILRI